MYQYLLENTHFCHWNTAGHFLTVCSYIQSRCFRVNTCHRVFESLALCHQLQEAAALTRPSDGRPRWPQTPFKEAVSVALRAITFCIPGLRWHQTPSPTKPQSLYMRLFFYMSLSLTLFPWRWSSIEFLPTKVRLVARCCSLGRDLDTVHRERQRGWWAGRERRASERLCDYITVIMQRLNSRAASFGVCREIALCTKTLRSRPLCVEKGAAD